jgi:hypothetical protein
MEDILSSTLPLFHSMFINDDAARRAGMETIQDYSDNISAESSLLSFMNLLFAVFMAVLSVRPGFAEPPDRLSEALTSVGLTRADIGCQPKAYWPRFPSIRHVPYLPHFFEDLFAEPLRTYEFSRMMAGAVEEYTAPAYRTAHDNAMFKTTHFLGVEKKIVGPRGYDEKDFRVAGRIRDTRAPGGDAVWTERQQKELKDHLKAVPPVFHQPLIDLLDQIADAWSWRQVAVARLPADDMQTLFHNPSLHDIQPGGPKYFPEIDRIARLLDEASLYYAAQKTVQAVEIASRAFQTIMDSSNLDVRTLHVEFLTPMGGVIVSGTGNDQHVPHDCAVLIDLGGNDTYEGPVGSTSSLSVPVSIAIDIRGDDVYRSASLTTPSQGAGILGVGVLLDCAGNDRYEAGVYAQGAGLFGFGLLWDEAGDDDYRVRYGGQGAGYFGVGLLVDVAGKDRYYLWGDGQGFGGVGGGVGVLADVSGDDHYIAEVDAHIAGRGDYHTHMRVPYSNAQGVGSGRRGDVSDGHAWAGGLGTLVDLKGNDTYESGNWAAGCGYWFGTGILYDGGGDDLYRSVYFSVASGAHFCIGALIDEAGNDRYEMIDPPVADDLIPQGQGMNAAGGAGLAFGWDVCMALLIDKGGDDAYKARIISGAQAMIRSTAILADLGGNDRYTLPRGAGGGNAAFMESYTSDLPTFQIEYNPYSHYGTNFGFLLDAGGNDQYFEWGMNGHHTPSPTWQDGHTWQQPAPSDKQYGYNSHGIGMDVESGTIPEFHVFEPRVR